MEAVSWAAVAMGIATAAIRLSRTKQAWPSLFVASGWAAWPWITGEFAARTSFARIVAWATTPDHLGAVATLVIAEAVVGGWMALGSIAARPEVEKTSLGTLLRGCAPSPSLGLGLFGVQISLFHRVSGQSFAMLNAAMSIAVVVGLVGLALAARSILPEPGKRAELAVPFYAALLLLGSALPPLIQRPAAPSRAMKVDVRAAMIVAVGSGAVVGLGLMLRLFRREWKAEVTR